jgi:uncharacterized membrane protein YhaH (DUF805 family)
MFGGTAPLVIGVVFRNLAPPDDGSMFYYCAAWCAVVVVILSLTSVAVRRLLDAGRYLQSSIAVAIGITGVTFAATVILPVSPVVGPFRIGTGAHLVVAVVLFVCVSRYGPRTDAGGTPGIG